MTFGDSVLDSGIYNALGLTPGQLLVRNDDQHFPEFRGRDLQSLTPVRLDHRARDGATSADLAAQLIGLAVEGPTVALLSIGGNDLLHYARGSVTSAPNQFRRRIEAFLDALPVRPVLVATIYDPSFGDDRQRPLGIDPRELRPLHRVFNEVLADAGQQYGKVIDIHRHFLGGDSTWFTRIIEPSLLGVSEVRRCFWPALSDFAVAIPADN